MALVHGDGQHADLVLVAGADRGVAPLRRDLLAEQRGDGGAGALEGNVGRLDAGHAVEADLGDVVGGRLARSEEHTSELQSLMRISYAVFCLKKKKERKI